MQIENAGGFNPNDSKFRACCCHSKSFVVVLGILEIFTICFVLVAVLPDLNTRVCNFYLNGDNETLLESTNFNNYTDADFDLRDVSTLQRFLCKNNVACILWTVIQILSVFVTFYGIKTIRFLLFIPHLFFRIGCTTFAILLQVWMIFLLTSGREDLSTIVSTIIFLSIFIMFWMYSTWIEIRCAEFIKQSRDTGFSISIARPLGPATISLSEREPQIGLRQLPPLRHTRNQYVVDEKNKKT